MIDDQIERFLESLTKATASIQTPKFWPANPPQMDSYWCDIFAKNLINTKLIPAKLPNIDVLRNCLGNYLIIGLKVLCSEKMLTKEESLLFLSRFFDAMKKKTNDDIFCSNLTNRIWSKEEVRKALRKIRFEEIDAKEVGYLHSILFAYCSSVCFDPYIAHGYYLHGPYDVREFFGEGCLLIVREFYDFKEEVWNQKRMKKVITFSIYKNNSFKIDFWNHLTATQPLPSTLISFSTSSWDAFQRIEEYEQLTKEQVEIVKRMRQEEIIMKSAEINFSSFSKLFGKKKVAEMLRMVEGSVSKNKLKYWERFKTVDQDAKKLRIIFDPRKISFK